MVGISGNPMNLLDEPMAMTLMELLLILPMIGVKFSKPSCISPDNILDKTSALDLNGITVSSSPLIALKSSADKFWVLPTLMVPIFNFPGLLLPYSAVLEYC